MGISCDLCGYITLLFFASLNKVEAHHLIQRREILMSYLSQVVNTLHVTLTSKVFFIRTSTKITLSPPLEWAESGIESSK